MILYHLPHFLFLPCPLSFSLSPALSSLSLSLSPLSSPLSLSLQLKNMDYFSQYVTDEDFEHYINRKRFDSCYGNNIEMQAIAEIYNRSIEVFQYTTGEYNINNYYAVWSEKHTA